MAVTKEEVISFIENMTVLELAGMVKELEEKFGVSAAAPVAVAAAARAGPDLPLQLPRARSGADSVHEWSDQERLRVRQPGDGRLRHGHDCGPLRVSGRLRGRRGILDHPRGTGVDE